MEWWSIAKYQIPSTKFQLNPKFQYPKTMVRLEFCILVIVICLEFVICYLEFLAFPILQENWTCLLAIPPPA
jgi:hypothetical protein